MRLFYTLFASLLVCQIFGQTPVWNKLLPASSNSSAPQVSLQEYADGYLISCQKNIIALTSLGEITGAIHTPYNGNAHVFGSFIRPKTDFLTGEKYFLLAGNNLGGPSTMAISEYRPGQGFVQETLLDETWGADAFSPVFIDLNDSTYFILGRKYFRQIIHHAGQGVATNWEKPNNLGNPNAGIITPAGIVGVGQNGVIFALDFLGNTLWADTTGYVLRDLRMVAGGFVAVGRTTDNSAVLVKFSSNGAIEWTKSYGNDLIFNNLVVEPAGSLTVTGQSDAGSILLRHLAADGSSLWRQTYQTGAGGVVLRRPDGYVVAGQFQSNCFAFRTDASGFTGPQERNLDPRKRTIMTDQLRVIASPSPNLFFDLQGVFFNASDSLTSLFVSAAPWLAALDQDSLLHTAANTYVNSGYSDYRSGFSQFPAVDFDRVWRITKDQITALRQDWADNGLLDRPVPFDISTWPAKGNIRLAYNLDFTKTTTDPSFLPAPFVDANNDGLYNPADGDYPQIKGDQMAWWILTDDTLHTRTGGRAFLADMVISMYTYDCPPFSPSDRSLLVDFEIINRSESTYSQMFTGIWVEQDIGCAETKLLGSLPASNAFYAYGRDTVNDASCPIAPFTSDWVSSVSFVNQSLDKFIYYYNGGVTPPPPSGTDDPGQDQEYYNYLRGKWRDGTVPTYNGQPLDFLFPDNPADTGGNSMCTNYPQFPDRRMIGSHGPFTLAPNDTFRLTTAFCYHPNIQEACPDIFGTVKNELDQLHALINSGALALPAFLPPFAPLIPGQSLQLDASVPGATAYNWSTGATTATISITEPGAYSVTITRITGCASVENILVTAATPTQEATGIDQLRVFPNPNTGQCQLEIHGQAQEEMQICLFNILGEIAQCQRVDFKSGALSHNLDYSQLPDGIYMLRLQAGEKTRTVKVVLQH